MKLGKYDIVALVVSALILAAILWFSWSKSSGSAYLRIEDENGSLLYPLSENRDIMLYGPAGKSLVRIEGGCASFIHSDCPDALCVQKGVLSGEHDWAACLPNKVFIYISGGGSNEVDAGVY